MAEFNLLLIPIRFTLLETQKSSEQVNVRCQFLNAIRLARAALVHRSRRLTWLRWSLFVIRRIKKTSGSLCTIRWCSCHIQQAYPRMRKFNKKFRQWSKKMSGRFFYDICSLRTEAVQWKNRYQELHESVKWRTDATKLEQQLAFRVEEMKRAKEYIR